MKTTPLFFSVSALGLMAACSPSLSGDWTLTLIQEDETQVQLIDDQTGDGTLIHIERTGTLSVDEANAATFTWTEDTTYTLDDPDMTTDPRTFNVSEVAEGVFEAVAPKNSYAVTLEGRKTYTLSCVLSSDLLDCDGVKDDTDPNTEPSAIQLSFSPN